MQNIRLSIVMAVHNRKDVTLQCLKQLSQQTYRHFTVIVVDDGSSDGTSQAILQHYPSTTVLTGSGSWWWTKCVNEGIRCALSQGSSHILLLNDDTYFTNDYVELVVREANEHPASIIGSLNLTMEKPHRVYFSGAKSLNRFLFKYKRHQPTFSLYKAGSLDNVPSIYLPARGALIPSAVFKSIGLLNEKHFPQYASDVDFTLKASESGVDMFVSPSIKLFTPVNSTGGGDIYKNESFFKFLSSFNNKYAKRDLRTNLMLIKHHVPIYIVPLAFLSNTCIIFTKYFIHKIKNSQ